MIRSIAIALFLIGTLSVAQNPTQAIPANPRSTATQTTSGSAAAHPAPTPPAEVLTPAPFLLNGEQLPGDSAVIADLSSMDLIQAQYQAQLKLLQDQAQPLYQAKQTQLSKDIDSVKKANKWGDDVTFNNTTRHFERAVKVAVPETKAVPAK